MEKRIFVVSDLHGQFVMMQLLLDKIAQHTGPIDMKEYKQYTGKLFLLYMFK